MALVDDDPYVEQLLDDASERPSARLGARELRTKLALGALLLAAVVGLALLAPSERALSPLGAIGLIAAYAIAQQIHFDVGAGYTVPSQLVLMPMLFLAPPALVPLLVAAGLLVGRLPRYLRRETHPSRLAFVLPDTWHAFGPAVVMAVLAPANPGLDLWPVLALALVAQVIFDAGTAVLRDLDRGRGPAPARASPPRMDLRRRRRAGSGRRARGCRRPAPAARHRGRAAAHGPARPLRARAACAHRQGAGPVARLSRHRAAHERPARGRRRLHRRRAQPRRRRAGPRGRQRPRARRARPPQPRVRRTAARHRQDPRARRDHQQARQAHRRGVRADQAPSRPRAGHARARRRRARRGRTDRSPPPRALGRRRLSRRHHRRDDPAGGAHHLRLRRLQRDDDQPALPRGAADGRCDRRARALLGRAVRPEAWSTRCCGRSPSIPSIAPPGPCSSSPPDHDSLSPEGCARIRR